MTIVHMDLSIIIPTFNERNNVKTLITKIRTLLEQQENCLYEIIFVDDSVDDTPIILEQLSLEFKEVTIIHRHNERGLASAVVKGFEHSQGDHLIVMDADLQHPPELIPLILKRLAKSDIVIPSRFAPGGSDGGLNLFRKFISAAARVIGSLSIKRLRYISDSTSGYFGCKRSVINHSYLNPIGWKILIEILVKGNYQTVHEIPYSFALRETGHSKMNLTEQWNYLRHIARLIRHNPEDHRFYCFCTIGTLGVLVNLLCLHIFMNVYNIEELSASIYSSCVAMLHNFIWNDSVTWKERKGKIIWKRLLHFPQFVLISILGIMITTLCAQLFVLLGWNIYFGQLTGISLATLWSYSANSKWTWSAARLETIDNHAKLVVTKELPTKMSCN